MSTAELIYSKVKTLPESAQKTLLQFVELLTNDSSPEPPARIQPGSAQGLIKIAEDFDAPLPDFDPYMR